MIKRILLFGMVNLAVIMTISFLLSILGIRPYLEANQINFQALLIFCSAIGFGGAFFSLMTSRWMAKTFMGVKLIDPNSPKSPAEQALLNTVHSLAKKAGLPGLPEVGIYESPEVNAFATGPSKARALVAVSTGLLNHMDSSAVEGVLGHEITHVANGDMVTMTLLQGVVNTFVMFFARILAWGVSQAMASRNENGNRSGGQSYMVQWMLISLFEFAFGLLGMIIVAFFSRQREFRADKGGATLTDRDKMIHALSSLKTALDVHDDRHPSISNLKINGNPRGLMALFQSHPALDVRIAALKNGV